MGGDDIIHVLEAVGQGEECSSARLLPMVYEELRSLAHARMVNERDGQTLQATALVHEAWLRLVGTEDAAVPKWANRAHFFAAAAESMRRILIDRGRSKKAARHGGGWRRIGMEFIDQPTEAPEDLLLYVSEAVDALAEEDRDAAELVKLRFFVGLTIDEAALAMGVSDRTCQRYWRFARLWLLHWLRNEATATPDPPTGS